MRHQYMFRYRRGAGKHRVMLNQPDFIMAVFIAHIGKVMRLVLRAEGQGWRTRILSIQNISVENEKRESIISQRGGEGSCG